MDERWGTERPLDGADQQSADAARTPVATVTNLRETLNEIGATIDVEHDVVMVYLASHGSAITARRRRCRRSSSRRSPRPR